MAMKTALLTTLLLGLTAAAAATAQAATFKLDVHAGDAQGHVRSEFVYNQSGCQGENMSPTIDWEGAPDNASGYAVTVHDPDADGGWWHWIVLDIPPTTHRLKQGEPLPPGAFALKNSFGHEQWDGPCPPVGDPPHHYVFTVYALDTAALGVAATDSPAAAKAAIVKHTLAKASVTLTYGRQ